jgi:hypothetical protein
VLDDILGEVEMTGAEDAGEVRDDAAKLAPEEMGYELVDALSGALVGGLVRGLVWMLVWILVWIPVQAPDCGWFGHGG